MSATDLIVKDFGGKISRAAKDGEIIARLTTTLVDDDGDVVLPSGMDLSRFKSNPTMFFVHEGRKLPIGRWLSLTTPTANEIIIRGRFTPRPPEHPAGVEWLPDTIKWFVQQGDLRGVSVGFRVLDSRPPTNRDKEKFGENARQIVVKWRMIEASIVPLPANQESLIMAVGKCLKTQERKEEKPKLVLDTNPEVGSMSQQRSKLMLVR